MKTIPINKWTITTTIIGSLLLIAIGSASAGTPETKTRTVTEYKTKTIEGETIYRDKTGLSSICREALVDSTQNMADFNQLVGSIGDAIVSFSETYDTSDLEAALLEQQTVIDAMLSAVKKTVECDSTIGQDIYIPGL